MFSGEVWLVDRKLDRQSVARLYAPELRIRSAVVTASAQRAAPFCRPPAVGEARLLPGVRQHVAARDTGEGIHPRPVDVLQPDRAVGPPGLAMDLEPAAVVVPVLAASRDHHLVGADLAQVVIGPQCVPE